MLMSFRHFHSGTKLLRKTLNGLLVVMLVLTMVLAVIVAFAVHIAPRVGYKISENLETGLMGSLNWQKLSYSYSTFFE